MRSPEPDKNPNSRLIVDPPWPLRGLLSTYLSRHASLSRRNKKRAAAETKRKQADDPHRIDYFHQLDDPYSHLTAQILRRFVDCYDIQLIPHLIRATGGKDQPESEKLARWAWRDCCLVAPHYGLSFPASAPIVPDQGQLNAAAHALTGLEGDAFVDRLDETSSGLWSGTLETVSYLSPVAQNALDQGSRHLADLGHYSGAIFHYGGEFYWGVDRLFHLEQRLMDLGLRRDDGRDYLVPRPNVDLAGVDASGLTLHFYPSLNSPYTSIIYDRTLALAQACGIGLVHKPVLPMIMRGVPATPNKSRYIFFDTKREAEHLGVPFGPVVMPIGTPTRRAYSLLGWASAQGKDTAFMSALLRLAFAQGVSLASDHGMRRAVTEAGLDWDQAKRLIGKDGWQDAIAENQEEMEDAMGLWGVPCYRLSGPDGEPDLVVWGQDRLWLVAAETKRRAGGQG